MCHPLTNGAPPCATYSSAVIQWDENHVPSLCPDTGTCGGVGISPHDMDVLAEQVWQGGDAETKALAVLDAVGKRYMTKVVQNQSNKCPAYPEQDQVDRFWKPCSGNECSMTTSLEFGRKKLLGTRGCGWWGRGVIQTSGPCNFGKLNKALARVKDASGEAMYKFNLCKTPEIICNTQRYPELKWIAGFFFWIEEVQGYASNADYPWTFASALPPATANDATFQDFVDATSGIVNRGCPSATACAAGPVDGRDDRRKNAKAVLQILRSQSGDLMSSVQNIRSAFNETVLKTNASYTKQTYDYDSFLTALNFVVHTGFNGKTFRATKENLAAFLGQCMKETLQYGACDENNWTGGSPSVVGVANDVCRAATSEADCGDTDTHPQYSICKWENGQCQQAIYGFTTPVYPSTAACGQLGQYYKGYQCANPEDSCDPNSLDDRVIVGVTHASWNNAPGPLFSDGTRTLGGTVYKWA